MFFWTKILLFYMEKDYSNLHRGLVMKYYWQVAKKYKFSLFAVIIAMIIASLLDVYIPLNYLKLWNVLSINNFSVVNQARSIIILILALNFTRFCFRRLSGFCLSYFEASTMAGLREQAFSYMMGHSHAFFANNFSGSLTQKINKYAKSFEMLSDRILTEGIPLIVRGGGTIVAFYIFLPKYAYMLGVFCFVFLITSFIYIRYKLKYDVIASEADSKTTGALADAIGNQSSIQLFTGHEYERSRVYDVTQDQRKKNTINWYLWEGVSTTQSFYTLCAEFILFWVVIGDWKMGLITLPVIVLLQNYFIRLADSLWSFGGIIRAYYENFANAEEMAVILDTPYEIKDDNEKVLKNVKGEIIFDHVSYVYENNNSKVLDDLSLHIPVGQKIALIGSSGAGKTTLVRLLLRLFNITSGCISIDGVDISKISQENLRENISLVPQDPILFHRTLMENIRYGRRDATDEEVLNAAHLAHCDEFIHALPNRYETYVGERGVKLSGGERQRVAIARAILKNSPILILDEATSSLDSQSEILIQDALHKLIKGKTTIVIAHRLSTIREMDRIIVLKKGKIIEDGTHEELINKDIGLYKKLWNLQAGGFTDES